MQQVADEFDGGLMFAGSGPGVTVVTNHPAVDINERELRSALRRAGNVEFIEAGRIVALTDARLVASKVKSVHPAVYAIPGVLALITELIRLVH